jgi:hypothetical protein
MKPISGRIDQTWVQHQLHEIRGLADEKEVSAREKALWEAVLAATALGMCENPKECARLALTSKRTLDVESPDRPPGGVVTPARCASPGGGEGGRGRGSGGL